MFSVIAARTLLHVHMSSQFNPFHFLSVHNNNNNKTFRKLKKPKKKLKSNPNEPHFGIKMPFMRDAFDIFVENAISDDVLTVPGIGPRVAEELRKSGVETTTQLIGVFLSMKRPKDTCEDHANNFQKWMNTHACTFHYPRVYIALGRKCKEKFLIPGIYDSSLYEES